MQGGADHPRGKERSASNLQYWARMTEILRKSIEIPDKRYICRPYLHPECRLDAAPAEVFRNALILGLCTAQMFDPERPVIWTRASLTRVVELFDPAGFYQ
jgi:hypothetical protein